ncbi:putative (E)-beta-ocimene synthase [Helianthus annuus]|uniref:(E)-beta-ocimene synthase n=1 Tax=Helianthus annuus TaxID=4232 RepID=A0A251RMM9_HELAN|nr:putative (E)-beta-ocimene synthase [Helianthus annuus]KAJ0428440.1 putative (E)-beta-ocimene synthase [Helianthus annuus]KAJ0432530.1 putative (E)-beta-ocimene synthase [Helianthus annuus]KAJ0812326.1 putative (E)-beta-ocimene synthase [Helianthus annuus]
MECFFWSVGIVFEPQYYSCRIMLTKVLALITTFDDIYDIYESLDELKALTTAVKRWDINAVENMPDDLHVGFLALFNTVNEMGYDTLITQRRNIIPTLAKVWGELCEAFFVEAKWTQTNYMPTLENYLDNAWHSASGVVILTHGYYLSMNQDVKTDATESLEKCHDLFKWSSMIFRLYNDLVTSSEEIDKGQDANAISCYMHETGVSEEVAREYIKTLIDKAWMKMITARVACSADLAYPIIDMAINLARVSNSMYQYGDGHGAPDDRVRDRVLSVIVEPITIRGKEK